MINVNVRRKTLSVMASALLISACASSNNSKGVSVDSLLPRISASPEVLAEMSAQERSHLQLIATNLVATLVQIPEMRPESATLQISAPVTSFGHAIVRAMEDAGFGLQLVSADQGRRYVSYSKRLSETESGLVTDYMLAVGKVSLSRATTPPLLVARKVPELPTLICASRRWMCSISMNYRKTNEPGKNSFSHRRNNGFSNLTLNVPHLIYPGIESTDVRS